MNYFIANLLIWGGFACMVAGFGVMTLRIVARWNREDKARHAAALAAHWAWYTELDDGD